MTPTEAELMGLSELALEMLYIRDVLAHLGFTFKSDDQVAAVKDPEAHRLVHAVGDMVHGPIEVGVDNSGAYDLVHRTTVGKNTKHVERRCYKMRELYHHGIVKLVLVPTTEMHADMLTKALDTPTFVKHRKRTMNLAS